MTAGCSVLAGYPEQENTFDACRDGVDNDDDGVTDCMDPGCLGAFCDEDTTRRDNSCSDGLDNDLDGLPDDFDPACWSVASGHVERCGTIRGTEWSLRTAAWAGGTWVDDPSGGGEAALALDATEDGEVSAVIAEPLTGDLDNGLVRTAIVVGEGATVDVLLEPLESTSPIRSGVAMRVRRLAAATPEISLRVGEQTVMIRTPSPSSDTRTHLTLRFDDGISLSAEADGSCPPESESCARIHPAIGLGTAPTFELRVRVSGGPVWVTELDVSRQAYDPCTTPVPFYGWPTGRLHAFAASSTSYCALFEDDSGRISTLGGDRTDADATLPLLQAPRAPELREVDGWIDGGEADLTDPVIDWDERGGSFRGATVVQRDGAVTGEVLLVRGTSDRCGGWSVLGEPVFGHRFGFDGRSGGVIGYDVDPSTGTHTLFTIRAGELGGTVMDIEQVRWESPTGEPGTFTPGTPERVNATVQERHPRINVTLLGGHQLVVRSNNFNHPGTLDAPNDSGAFTVLEPSGVLGTFDSLWIEQGLLWMPEPRVGQAWWGLFVYCARSCADCPAELGFARFQPAFTQVFPEPMP